MLFHSSRITGVPTLVKHEHVCIGIVLSCGENYTDVEIYSSLDPALSGQIMCAELLSALRFVYDRHQK